MEAVDHARAGYSDKVAALQTSSAGDQATATADQSDGAELMASTAAGELSASLLQTLCHPNSPSDEADATNTDTAQLAFSLNIDANEFVPSSHSLNVNATIFTPCSYGEL